MPRAARRSARVLLPDADDRLLLLRSARVPGKPEHGVAWFPPGGGVEPDLSWVSGLVRDDFFLHRVTSHRVDSAGLTEFERRHHSGQRWWTQPQLSETTETVYPHELAALLADLIAGRIPGVPIRLPFAIS